MVFPPKNILLSLSKQWWISCVYINTCSFSLFFHKKNLIYQTERWFRGKFPICIIIRVFILSFKDCLPMCIWLGTCQINVLVVVKLLLNSKSLFFFQIIDKKINHLYLYHKWFEIPILALYIPVITLAHNLSLSSLSLFCKVENLFR